MILTINPLASARTPQQIATQDISQFNEVASLISERMQNGIPGTPEGSPVVINQQGQAVSTPRPNITAEQYLAGLTAAIGAEAVARLQAAAAVLNPPAQ